MLVLGTMGRLLRNWKNTRRELLDLFSNRRERQHGRKIALELLGCSFFSLKKKEKPLPNLELLFPPFLQQHQ